MPEDEQLTSTALELVAFVEQRLQGYTTRAQLHQLVSVGALFARSASLLRTIDLLRCNGTNAGAGILVRAVFEANLLLLYIALGGEDAFLKVMGDFRRHLDLLHERNPGAKYSDDEFEWAFETSRLNLEQVAKDVGPLLSKAGDKSGADATGIYDSLYRATSTFDAHGIGVTVTHVDATNEKIWRVLVAPGDNGISSTSCLQLGAFYTAWVGQWAWAFLGFDRKPMVEFTNRLATAFEAVLPPEADLP